MHRIGFLGMASAAESRNWVDAFRAGLREHGYVEGANIEIEYRFASGTYDRLTDLAAELVQQRVAVLVTHGTPGTRAASRAAAGVPVVMAISSDAVANGLVAGLARPGGLVTGSTYLGPQLNAKRIELIRDLLPHATRVAVLFNFANPANAAVFEAVSRTAATLGLQLLRVEVARAEDISGAFEQMSRQRVDAVAVEDDAMLAGRAAMVAQQAAKQRIPSAGRRELAEAGGLMAYGQDNLAMYRRAAYFVDRILKGTKPADLPIEQPTRFELVINRGTAAALGLQLPQSVLLRADRLIE
jgi:putative ABC transport system substrate-binding protein